MKNPLRLQLELNRTNNRVFSCEIGMDIQEEEEEIKRAFLRFL